MNETTSLIAESLQSVADQLTRYSEHYKRTPGSVQLLAVSKRKPLSAITAAISCGQRSFGENYVDEGVEKILALADSDINADIHSDIEWHFIGAIQSRKCASIARHFQWAHGVDRLKVAAKLSAQRPADMPALNICLQVNLDDEHTKAGVAIEEVRALATECADLPGINLRGLMAIPAPRSELHAQRQVFCRLRACLESLQADFPNMDTLSMGMSGDMEAAVAEGATIVRVGTAIFGARDS